MWFLPAGARLIPPRRVPGEAGSTPRTPTRREQTTTYQDPEVRREVSAAPQTQNQPSAPSEPPRSPRLRVSYETPRLRVSLERPKGRQRNPEGTPALTHPAPPPRSASATRGRTARRSNRRSSAWR